MDNAATTRIDPRVVSAMNKYFAKTYGNPSSKHYFGEQAKKGIDYARNMVCSNINCLPSEVIFTSGGTESNNFAIKGIAYANRHKGNHIIISKIEHHSISEPCEFLKKEGFEITYVPVNTSGYVDVHNIINSINKNTILVSIMHSNNEIGTIQPIISIGEILQNTDVYFHTDAVQSIGKCVIDVNILNVDLLSASSHKFYGPKGVGFLYVKEGTKIDSFMHGGEQEKGRRAGTYNVPAIVGMGKALELISSSLNIETPRILEFRNKIINRLVSDINGCYLNGGMNRLSNNISLSFDDIDGETLVEKLDNLGISCSVGSACSSAKMEPSHVLMALGLDPDRANNTIRISLGRFTTLEDVTRLIESVEKILKIQRKKI